MSNLENWSWNLARVPGRAFGTIGMVGADIIKTNWWALQDAWNVIVNTTDKIVSLFSQDQKRYEKALNIPVSAWIWLVWAVETAIEPMINKIWNYWKTVLNFVTNSWKTIWSLFSTKPVSDTKFNTIKRKWKEIHIDTKEHILDTNKIWTKNRWFQGTEKEASKEEQEDELQKKLDEINND